jgi:hypothetical protein
MNKNGRRGGIRTRYPLHPMQVLASAKKLIKSQKSTQVLEFKQLLRSHHKINHPITSIAIHLKPAFRLGQ